jgi:hypothetical protein
MTQQRGAFTAIVDRTSEPTIGTVGDGTLVSTLAGAAYGHPRRAAVLIHATAAGAFEFNIALRGFNAGKWGPIGLGEGDMYAGELCAGSVEKQWYVEGDSVLDCTALCAVATNVVGSPTITVSVAPIVEF